MIWLALAHAEPVELRILARGTGNPVPAVVTGGGIEVATGPDGRLVWEVDGPTVLEVSAEGWLSATLELSPPLPRVERIWLTEGRQPLEVVVEAFRPTPDVSRHVVDAEMAFETPGNLEDAVRLVQSMPGVAVQREYGPSAGTLTVRGSAPHDSRYWLDGIEIPYLYHFNQYASVFPASQLRQLELFSSTFGARFGDAVGAIVEAETSRQRPDAVHGAAFVNFVIAGGEVRAPVGKDAWVAVSGRRSYQDLAGEQSAQYTVWPVFSDLSARFEVGDEARGTGLFVLGASDGYGRAAGELDLLDPVEAQRTPKFTYDRGFTVVGLRHHWSAPSAWGRAVVGVVDDRLEGALTGNGSQRQRGISLNSRVDASHRFTRHTGWDLGLDLKGERTDLEVVDPGSARALVADEAPALARGIAVDDRMDRVQGGLYGIAHLGAAAQDGSPGIRFMPGVRVGFDSTSGEATLEPRAAVRVQASRSTELRLAAGRYTQRPPTEHLFPGTGDPSLPTTTSWQVAGGLEQTVAGRLTINLEAYGKQLSDVLIFPIDRPAEVAPRGDAIGAELTARYRIRDLFFVHGWLSLSRSRVQLPGSAGGWVPSDGDQPVNVGLVASWDPTDALQLGLRYRLGSGLPFTPLDGSVYDAGVDGWIPIPAGENSARLPLYQKLDLRVAWTFTFRRFELTTSAEMWIVPPASAQLYPAWNYDYTEQNWVRGPTLLPLLGAHAKF